MLSNQTTFWGEEAGVNKEWLHCNIQIRSIILESSVWCLLKYSIWLSVQSVRLEQTLSMQG